MSTNNFTVNPVESKVETLDVLNEPWIAFLFDNLPEGCLPVATGSPYHPKDLPDGAGKVMKGQRIQVGATLPAIGGFDPFQPSFNTYLNCASFKADEQGRFRKDKAHYGALHAFLIDDVGPKVDPASLEGYPPPTMKLETSKDNFQWWYKLNPPIADYDLAQQFVAAVVAKIPNDGAGPSRWGRLPIGCNTKQGGSFSHRVVHIEPVAYSQEQIVEAFGLTLGAVASNVTPIGTRRRIAGADAIADWLLAKGYVKKEGLGWLEITCPWSRIYTPGGHDNSSGSKYFLPDDKFPSGGFRCHHHKCDGKGVNDLIDYCVAMAQMGVQS